MYKRLPSHVGRISLLCYRGLALWRLDVARVQGVLLAVAGRRTEHRVVPRRRVEGAVVAGLVVAVVADLTGVAEARQHSFLVGVLLGPRLLRPVHVPVIRVVQHATRLRRIENLLVQLVAFEADRRKVVVRGRDHSLLATKELLVVADFLGAVEAVAARRARASCPGNVAATRICVRHLEDVLVGDAHVVRHIWLVARLAVRHFLPDVRVFAVHLVRRAVLVRHSADGGHSEAPLRPC